MDQWSEQIRDQVGTLLGIMLYFETCSIHIVLVIRVILRSDLQIFLYQCLS